MTLLVAYPPLWLPVLVLTAAASPSPPPSSMPPPPSSPPAYVFKSLYWLKRAAQEFDVDPAMAQFSTFTSTVGYARLSHTSKRAGNGSL